MASVVEAAFRTSTTNDAIQASLDAVRGAFGWTYATYWALDQADAHLRPVLDSGTTDDGFRHATFGSAFPEGVGLTGQAWRERDLVFTADVATSPGFARATEARRAGLRSAVCVPIQAAGRVVGVMELLASEVVALTSERRDALGHVAMLVSVAIERGLAGARALEGSQDAQAAFELAGSAGRVTSSLEAARLSLDTVCRYFDWTYGTYWAVDPASAKLVPMAEAGSVHANYRGATKASSFAEGVGLPGRAWKQRDFVFIDDVKTMQGFARATEARQAGLTSAICYPIESNGRVVGVMDFTTAQRVVLSKERKETLQTIARLVSSAMERLIAVERERETGRAIDSVSVQLTSASSMLTSVASQLAAGATQTSAQAGVVADAAAQMRENVASVASAAEQMSATVREIATNAAESARTAHRAKDLAGTANTAVQALSASSAAIDKVTKAIATIARQTNLLALNAAIEAARAGGAGKGFAVVANEVKELAKETATATQEIAERIEAIHRDTETSVVSIGEIVDVVNQIDGFAASIAKAVLEQSATVRDIAHNANEASAGVAHVVANIGGVAQAAKDAERHAAEMQSAANGVGSLAETLGVLTRR